MRDQEIGDVIDALKDLISAELLSANRIY